MCATKCCGQNETRFKLLDAILEHIANLTVDSLEHSVLCEQEMTQRGSQPRVTIHNIGNCKNKHDCMLPVIVGNDIYT